MRGGEGCRSPVLQNCNTLGLFTFGSCGALMWKVTCRCFSICQFRNPQVPQGLGVSLLQLLGRLWTASQVWDAALAHLWSAARCVILAAGTVWVLPAVGRPPTMFATARLLSDLLEWALPGTVAGSPVRFLCWEAGTERRASAHGRAGVLKRPEAA